MIFLYYGITNKQFLSGPTLWRVYIKESAMRLFFTLWHMKAVAITALFLNKCVVVGGSTFHGLKASHPAGLTLSSPAAQRKKIRWASSWVEMRAV